MKKMRLLFGMVLVAILLIVPAISTNAESNNCYYRADFQWNPATQEYNNDCPLMSGPDWCTAACDYFVNPG